MDEELETSVLLGMIYGLDYNQPANGLQKLSSLSFQVGVAST